MLRPGWFPEYSPRDQKIFDTILDRIRDIFEQRNFQHIRTPAVEKNEVLLKGGETVANEIFGLHSIKPIKEHIYAITQYIETLWNIDDNKNLVIQKLLKYITTQEFQKEDLETLIQEKDQLIKWREYDEKLMKDKISELFWTNNNEWWLKKYSLHFDLTVPFARYTLDHLNELVFPFKRYQMQPVWRGERQQRGRFREFRQCDVDSIWKSWTSVGYRYGAETIATLQSAIQSVFSHYNIQKSFVSHVSHIGLTKAFLAFYLDNDDAKVKAVTDLLDKYYKKEHDVFATELQSLVSAELAEMILKLIETKDYSILSNYDEEAFQILDSTIITLQKLWAKIVFDITIVRGLGYYTDIVFETFLEEEIALGSICSGGGYEDFTKFLDPKQVYSWIGGSIGLSRLMEIILEQASSQDSIESYLFVNFEETFDAILSLYTRFLSEWKICELYPTAAKFGKQLEYADKKWISKVVILGTTEQQEAVYIIKDLATGEQQKIDI